ncbi:MAG: Fpg/Nei family DNA glycosylase [Marmoricola sp.]
MPEGDTVWQAARRLRRLDGQTLTGSDFRTPALATRDLSGRQVLTTTSRGKHLLTRVEGGLSLHSHLGMDGGWTVGPAGERWRRPAYLVRVVLSTATDQAVGHELQLDLVRTEDEDTFVGHLGPDLLGPDWDAAEAVRRIAAHPDEPIAAALMDQRNLAGIGNVYKAEICFLLGIDPHTPVRALPDLDRVVALAKRLLEANRERSGRVTTGDQRRGRRTWVYGRRGPCLRCGTLLRHDELGPVGQERGTWWCPSCQPPTAG